VAERICFRCGAAIGPGAHAYRLRLEMTADFDGYIDADALAGSNEDAAFEAMTAAADRTAEELSEEVYRERTLMLCPPCAKRLWADVAEPR
jgi:hypothetical protein